MCQAVKCVKCSKMGWRGCGMHVEQVLANVAKDERCVCVLTGGLPGISDGNGIPGKQP